MVIEKMRFNPDSTKRGVVGDWGTNGKGVRTGKESGREGVAMGGVTSGR